MLEESGLLEKIKAYNEKADFEAITRAFEYAKELHADQKRASGEPYITHPLEVACILADMHLDSASIITAILHDTVEDTAATLDTISKLFGEEISELVNGVTKLSQIDIQSGKSQQAENFRKLVLAMSNDLRVLLVKLADRLHNMRTLKHVNIDKQRRVARETLDIYAPLSGRIGLVHIKDELEDLAFEVLNSDAHASITTRLLYLKSEDLKEYSQRDSQNLPENKKDDARPNKPQNNTAHRGGIDVVIHELQERFNHEGLKASISGRIKRPYSIWRKMHHNNVTIEQLLDIVAFRIIVDTTEACYRALGILHSNYSVIPDRFKDYISTPKSNGYQSLHTCIVGPKGHRVEMQIRSREMHEVAEWGVAAHWQYKQGQFQQFSDKEKATLQERRWLRSLLEILESASGAEEFLEHTKLEMFADQVFCFTPDGDLVSLPNGATPIDFAYAIHSEVGNHCMAARVNGRMVPFRTILKNGDQVEITTAKSQHPSPSWERFVVTGKARAKIRKFVRAQKRNQFTTLGKSILNKAFEAADLDYTEKQLEGALQKVNAKSVEDLHAFIGEGILAASDIIKAIYPNYSGSKKAKSSNISNIYLKSLDQTSDYDQKGSLPLRGLIPGMAVHYAGCCHPLPGDRIVGVVMSGRGVTIHTFDCDMLKNFASEPGRWIDVSWADEENQADIRHTGRLMVLLENTQGALASLTTTLSKNHCNIINLKVTNRSKDFFEVNVDVEVKSSDHLSEVIASLRASTLINIVERI